MSHLADMLGRHNIKSPVKATSRASCLVILVCSLLPPDSLVRRRLCGWGRVRLAVVSYTGSLNFLPFSTLL